MDMVVEMLQKALDTWNGKLTEVWNLLSQSPEVFRDGRIWEVIENIFNALQGIGFALLVLFFLFGVIKSFNTFTEVKKPEHAIKLFIRFILAKTVITYGLEFMKDIFIIINGVMAKILEASGQGVGGSIALPTEIITAIEGTNFLDHLLVWIIAFVGNLGITVVAFMILLTVYGRFFKIYLFTALAPIPLAFFAGEPTQSTGVSFCKSYLVVCMEGAVILLACVIYGIFASAPPNVAPDAGAMTMVMSYVGELIFNMMILVITIKAANATVREMFGH